MTRNVIRSHRRRGWVKRWMPGPMPDVADQGPGTRRRAEMSETCRQIDDVIRRVPQRQREVLVLCDLEERTAKDVATLLGVPVGTIKSRLRLARASFLRIADELAVAPDLAEAARGTFQ